MNPVRSIGELNKLLAEMRAALPYVRVPVLLVHSTDDGYVLPDQAEKIYAELATPDKQQVVVRGTGHVITRDAARLQVFEEAHHFIQHLEAAS